VIEEEAFDDDDEEDSIVQSLKDVFSELDHQLSPQYAMDGGCTGSVVVRWGLHLYIANAGDSRSFVATYDTETQEIKIPYITREDKPNLPDEKARIEQANGNVFIPPPPKNPSLSRVIVYSTTKKENVGLAMSRSIGDWEWGAVGVTAEPIVDKVDIQDLAKPTVQLFVVSASDGLFDARRPEFIATHLAESFYGTTSNSIHPLVACENIFRLATLEDPTWYRDDITLSAIKVVT